MTTETSSGSRKRGGFTLLELVLAIGLLALLVGMIFGVASQNIALGNAVVRKQNESSVDMAMFELLGNKFAALPGNARFHLLSTDSGAQYLSDLTLQNVPLSFTWGGVEQVAKAVQLSTVRRRSGLLDIVLRYYNNAILDETEEIGSQPDPLGNEPFAEVILLSDVYIFEWRVLDGRTMEWQYDWDLVGRLPLQLELTYVATQYSEPMRQVFWITPKQNPEVMMRQLQQAGGGGIGGGGGGGIGDPDGDGPPGGGGRPGGGGGRPGGGGGRPGGGGGGPGGGGGGPGGGAPGGGGVPGGGGG